jgi:hypothetical protein
MSEKVCHACGHPAGVHRPRGSDIGRTCGGTVRCACALSRAYLEGDTPDWLTETTEAEPLAEPEAPGSMLAAVRASIGAVETAREDSGAAALAERYADLMDRAEPTKQYGGWIRKVDAFLDQRLSGTVLDEQVATAWTNIRLALAEHSVASDMGPKLLDALHKLGATPAARGEGKPAGAPVIPMANPLEAAAREAREARERRGQAG